MITLSQDIWTTYHTDLVAGIKAFSECILFTDAMNDTQNRLIFAETEKRMKVYKSNILQNEGRLSCLPVGMAEIYAFGTTSRVCLYLTSGTLRLHRRPKHRVCLQKLKNKPHI